MQVVRINCPLPVSACLCLPACVCLPVRLPVLQTPALNQAPKASHRVTLLLAQPPRKPLLGRAPSTQVRSGGLAVPAMLCLSCNRHPVMPAMHLLPDQPCIVPAHGTSIPWLHFMHTLCSFWCKLSRPRVWPSRTQTRLASGKLQGRAAPWSMG